MIPLFKVFCDTKSTDMIAEIMESGYIGQGPKVEEFESKLKEHFDFDHLLSVNSATSAEHLALHLLKAPHPNSGWPGISSDDEVLTTPLTCTATNWPILANNFKIKWVDVDPASLNMDLDDLARKITSKTKAIVVVHWGGMPIDLDKLKSIQNNAYEIFGFKPAIIEDCAHAFGSRYKNQLIGTHGNLCTFSFQAIKHLTCGDGGLLCCPNVDLYNRGKLLRWYGIDREGDRKDFRCEADVLEWGFKFHMNDINACIGLQNIKSIDWLVDKHKENAKFYNSELTNIHGLTLLDNPDFSDSAYWLFSVKVENRSEFMRYMKDKGIMTSRVHERNDLHTCVKEFRSLLPGLDGVCDSMVSIPVGWWVSEDDRAFIVEAIRAGW